MPRDNDWEKREEERKKREREREERKKREEAQEQREEQIHELEMLERQQRLRHEDDDHQQNARRSAESHQGSMAMLGILAQGLPVLFEKLDKSFDIWAEQTRFGYANAIRASACSLIAKAAEKEGSSKALYEAADKLLEIAEGLNNAPLEELAEPAKESENAA